MFNLRSFFSSPEKSVEELADDLAEHHLDEKVIKALLVLRRVGVRRVIVSRWMYVYLVRLCERRRMALFYELPKTAMMTDEEIVAGRHGDALCVAGVPCCLEEDTERRINKPIERSLFSVRESQSE